jgi:hypothetical protein
MELVALCIMWGFGEGELVQLGLISCEESLSTGVVFVSSLWCIWPNLGKLRNWRIWNYVCCCCLRGKRVRGRGRISVLATWINERNERFAWLIGIKVSGSMTNCMRWGVGVWCLANLGWNYDSHEGERSRVGEKSGRELEFSWLNLITRDSICVD